MKQKKPKTLLLLVFYSQLNLQGFLNLEGLDYYKEFGPTSIKTTISPLNGKMEEAYPFNHTWPVYQTMADVAQNQYIDSLFKRTHIKTHTFWTNTKNRGDYRLGPDFNHNSYLSMEQQFYDLTVHILQNYGTTNKTFVYQIVITLRK